MDISTSRVGSRRVRLGGKFIVGLLLIVAGLSAFAVSSGRTADIRHEGNPKVETQNTTTADLHDLNFSISVENSRWEMGSTIPVKLRVQNTGKVPVEGICSFRLNDPKAGSDPYKQGRNLWAPIIVQAEGVNPAVMPGPASSLLNPGQTIDVQIDLQKLNWAKAIQSTWPDGTLAQNAEAGDYEFSFRINVRIGETSEVIESNKVKVSIK